MVSGFPAPRSQPMHGPGFRFGLQGGVMDGEAFGEQGVAGVEHGFPLAQIPHHQMRGEQGLLRSDAPDVQVVHRGHAGYGCERPPTSSGAISKGTPSIS